MNEVIEKSREDVQSPIFVIDQYNVMLLNKDKDKVSFKGFVDPQDVISHMSGHAPIVSPILPSNTILYKRRNKQSMIYHSIMIELPPKIHHIRFYDKSFNIAYPYLYFYIQISESIGGQFAIIDAHVGSRASPLQYTSDILYIPWIPNVGGGGRVCWGTATTKIKGKSIREACQDLINNFFNSRFNDDLRMSVPSHPAMDFHYKNTEERLGVLQDYTKEKGGLWPIMDAYSMNTLSSVQELLSDEIY